MLRVAILHEDDKVYVEFTPEKFKKLLLEYFEKTKDLGTALDKIVKDIKKETYNK